LRIKTTSFDALKLGRFFGGDMRKLMLAVALTLVVAIPAAAQEGASVDLVLYEDMEESFESAIGALYKYRLAPLSFGGAFVLSDTISVDGRFGFSYLYDPVNPPAFAFATNYIGKMMEFEAALGWKPFGEHIKFRGGVSHMFLERSLLFPVRYPRFQFIDVQTTYTGPMLGVWGYTGDIGKFLAMGGVDVFAFMTVRDSYFPGANSTSLENLGIRAQGTVGYKITDHWAITATPKAQRIKNRYSLDGNDPKQRNTRRSISVGVLYLF
jgi:hypothetical protein